MDASVTDREEMFLLGVEEVFAPGAHFDAEAVMFQRFAPKADVFAKYATDPALYALAENRRDGSSAYMVARRVEPVDALPPGLPADAVVRRLPASRYVDIKTTPRELGPEADDKIVRWLTAHPECREDRWAPQVEFYPPSCADADDVMWVWVPLAAEGSSA